MRSVFWVSSEKWFFISLLVLELSELKADGFLLWLFNKKRIRWIGLPFCQKRS